MRSNLVHPSGDHFVDIAVLAKSVTCDLVVLCECYKSLSRNNRDRLEKGVRGHFRSLLDNSLLREAIERVQLIDYYLICRDDVDDDCVTCPFTGVMIKSQTDLATLRQALRLLWKNRSVAPQKSATPDALTRLAASGTPGRGAGHLLRPHIETLLQRIPFPELENLTPRHGPGAVAHGERGVEKWDFSLFYEQWLGLIDPTYFHYNERHWMVNPKPLELLAHPLAKLVEVPKDVRANRVISIETKEMQFVQQAIARYMMSWLEKASNGQIKFSSQDDHIRVMVGCGLSVATVDLKDASDLVSRRLVWNAFPEKWRKLLFPFRSQGVVHDDKVTPLRAFAPMGNALCFVVESIVHWACCQAAYKQDGLTSRGKLYGGNHLSVYGDDIIVDAQVVNTLFRTLRVCGLKPNTAKCCFRSNFRETCGTDVLISSDTTRRYVTPVYIKTSLARLTVRELPGLIVQCNSLYATGFENAATYLARRMVASRLGRYIMEGPDRYHISFPVDTVRLAPTKYNWRYQRLVYLVLSVKPRGQRMAKPDGYDGLFSAVESARASEVSYTPARGYRVNCRWELPLV